MNKDSGELTFCCPRWNALRLARVTLVELSMDPDSSRTTKYMSVESIACGLGSASSTHIHQRRAAMNTGELPNTHTHTHAQQRTTTNSSCCIVSVK
jgi:hypothetical protein